MSESSSKNKTLSNDHNISSVGFSEVNLVMRMPLMTCFEENENFKTYCGYLSDHHSQVLVRRFIGQLDCGLSGYYKGKNGTVLVYPFTRRWTLDRFLHDSKGKQWTKMTFQEKIKIAIGIGEGVRYMPCNVFLNFDLEPQITGFGNATWLHLKQGLPISSNRFWHTDPSNLESLALLKSNIIHFGILLLRLFCIRSSTIFFLYF
ncbi:hypothetical protein CsSME_00013025 [Camellia sinensis var. sinensis]